MARIKTYETDDEIYPLDKVIGTDGNPGVNFGATKNYTIEDLAAYFSGSGGLPALPLGAVYVGTGLSTPVSTTSTVVNVSDLLNSITIGENNVATWEWSMAQGFESYAPAPYSAALGYKAHALGNDSFASGHNSYAGGHGSAALGYGASAGNEGAASFAGSGVAVAVILLKDVVGVITEGMYMLTGF